MIAKRLFDFLVSFVAICFLLLPGFIIAIIVAFGSKGGAFYRQIRVGKNEKLFKLLKFRTMYSGSDKKGLLTIGSNDNRVTMIGRFLRKTKLDELPQLINIFVGHMSFVGPRPEVLEFTILYNNQQRKVLSVRPGLTDVASIAFFNESEILAAQQNPRQYYIDVVMPAKLVLNIEYINNRSFFKDIGIILKTIARIF
jgi:lipopolysaccharide/colanic/teichoic acid biosynthesis glycosyltransferase